MKIGFYPGVFDILHTGHILAIEEAKKRCDYLIVGLHCHPVYKQPIQSTYERFVQLDACKYVDKVIPYDNASDCRELLKSLDFDTYFLGEDHKGQPWENDSLIRELGKEIVFLPRQHGFSSTYIKDRVIAANSIKEKKNHE